MRVILTGSRAPVALELIRAFGRAGHEVYATDSLAHTLGSRSRYVRRHLVTPAPRRNHQGYAEALARFAASVGADWLIPTSEEIFAVARQRDDLAEHVQVLCEPLSVLRRLHNKWSFQQFAASLGIATPRTALIESAQDLARELPNFPYYLLKPAFSRFAARIITNTGPRAHQTPLSACRPTPAQPWLLQEFVAGPMVCTYSVFHHGRPTAHCAYATPRTAGQGAGIRFVSLDGRETLAVAARIAQALGFTGQMSLDFVQTADGLRLLECNPRATSGVHFFAADELVAALTNPAVSTVIVPAGQRRQLAMAMLVEEIGRPWRWPDVAGEIWRDGDVILNRDDRRPALAQLPMVLHFWQVARRQRISLSAAMTDDIEWNGE